MFTIGGILLCFAGIPFYEGAPGVFLACFAAGCMMLLGVWRGQYDQPRPARNR